VEEKGAEAARELALQSLAARDSGEVIDRVGAPQCVEGGEYSRQQAVIVQLELQDSGEKVRSDVLLSRTPDRDHGEIAPVLQVRDREREALQLGVWRSSQQKLAPWPAASGEGGDGSPEDEHAPQVVQYKQVAPAAEQRLHGVQKAPHAEQLAECGAGRQDWWQGGN
jgi:hypothetical protein